VLEEEAPNWTTLLLLLLLVVFAMGAADVADVADIQPFFRNKGICHQTQRKQRPHSKKRLPFFTSATRLWEED